MMKADGTEWKKERVQCISWYNQSVRKAGDGRSEACKMPIRPLQQGDLDAVMCLWLTANTQAHAFIPSGYWHSCMEQVHSALLRAQVLVYERAGEIYGFIGMQKDYIAGLFVERNWRSHGIGHELLRAVKAQHKTLTLSVYEQNEGAMRFYKREGFVVVRTQPDMDTGAIEAVMVWEEEREAPDGLAKRETR